MTFDLRGKIAPFLEVSLVQGEGLICDRSCVLQYDHGLAVKAWPGLGGSRWLVVNTQSEGEASVMLTTAEPGCAGSFKLSDYGGKLICLADSLMANGPGVTASYYARFANLGLSLVMLEGDGWAFLRSRGDVFEYRMAAGEKLCVRAQNVAAITATVDFEPIAPVCEMAETGEMPEFVTLTGPGCIWMQSITRRPGSQQPEKRAPDNASLQEMRTAGLAFLNGSSA
ncbi:MAG TPA: AIM24 family protein [Rhizobiales bacterium]|nr:AIM24 family protein [Hyphomicrobiales bacterium]